MKNDEAADHCETLIETAKALGLADFYPEALTRGAASLRAEAKRQDCPCTHCKFGCPPREAGGMAAGIRVDAKRMAEIKARADAAFKGPWTHDACTVECSSDAPRCPEAVPDDCEGERETIRIEAPEEYPDGQVVADVYGLETFTAPNAAFIAEARTDVPDLLADLEEARCLLGDALQAIAGLRESGSGSVAAVSVSDRAELMGYLPSNGYIPNLVASLRVELRAVFQTQENLEIRLMETERARLETEERAQRAEAELDGLRSGTRAATPGADVCRTTDPQKLTSAAPPAAASPGGTARRS